MHFLLLQVIVLYTLLCESKILNAGQNFRER